LTNRPKHATHFTSGPVMVDDVYRWLSLCEAASRWSFDKGKTWTALVEDADAVTCVKCLMEMRR